MALRRLKDWLIDYEIGSAAQREIPNPKLRTSKFKKPKVNFEYKFYKNLNGALPTNLFTILSIPFQRLGNYMSLGRAGWHEENRFQIVCTSAGLM